MQRELTGREVVAAGMARLETEVAQLAARGVTPTLALLRVGASPDDLAYERQILRRCEAAGVRVQVQVLEEAAGEAALAALLDAVSADEAIHGCLLFRPLPAGWDEAGLAERLVATKDIDGMTRASHAQVYSGEGPGYAPCTAAAVFSLLDHYGIALEGQRVAIVGRSLVVGRPAALLAMRRHATVTVCHTRTRDLGAVCREADIVIVAAGRRGVVTRGMLRDGQVLVDVGIHVLEDGGLAGDLDPADWPDDCQVTPVPRGLGPVTTLVLAEQVIAAAKAQTGG